MSLRETIAKAIADTSEHSACDWDWCVPENKASFLDYADIALRVIAKDYVLIDCDDAAHIYDVLMATGKTKTARLVFDAMVPKP